MFLLSCQLTRDDLRHLYCTDPQLADEVGAINRSLLPHRGVVTGWLNVLPDTVLAEREVPLCQPR